MITTIRAMTQYTSSTDATVRTGGTKEFRATTLLDMGGSPSLEKWFTVRPKKIKHLDAGFAVTIFRRNRYLIPIQSAHSSFRYMKNCENGSK